MRFAVEGDAKLLSGDLPRSSLLTSAWCPRPSPIECGGPSIMVGISDCIVGGGTGPGSLSSCITGPLSALLFLFEPHLWMRKR